MSEVNKIEKLKNLFNNSLLTLSKNFGKLSPYLLCSSFLFFNLFTTTSTEIKIIFNNIIKIPFLKNLLESIGFDFVSQHVNDHINKIFKLDKKEVKKEDIDLIISEIVNINQIIENVTKENLEINRQVLEISRKLINDENFLALINNIDKLKNNIDLIKNEIDDKLNEIYKEIKIISESNISKIDKILKKDLIKEPMFFRNEGVLYIDLEKNYVYKPKVIDNILDRLKKEKIIVIKGKPASGKTTILRYLGYLLYNKGYDVYYIDLKTFPVEKISEISKIKHGVLIIDDAHLNIKLVEDVVINAEVKTIISCRDIEIEKIFEFGPTRQSPFNEYLKNAIYIDAIDQSNNIIKKYEQVTKTKISKEVKNNLSKNNLWLLNWQLIAYKENNNINDESVYKSIKNYIENLPSVKNPEKALLPLSIFYKYEIKVRSSYILENFCNNDNSLIKELEKLNEIISIDEKGKTYLLLNHSEIANFYLETFKYFEDFGRSVKKRIISDIKNKLKFNTDYIDVIIFLDYINEFPEEFSNLFTESFEYETNSQELKYEIINSDKFKENFTYILKNLKMFSFEIFICFDEYKKIIKPLIESIDIEIVYNKILEWDDLVDLCYFLDFLKNIEYKNLEEIIIKIDLKVFTEKIEKSEDPLSIEIFISTLTNLDYEKFSKLINKIDIEIFEKKLIEYKEENFEDEIPSSVLSLLGTLERIKYKKFRLLLEKLGIRFFENKISSLNNIDRIIEYINILHKKDYLDLNKININVFLDKIEKFKDPLEIANLLEVLNEVKYINLKNILDKFNYEYFKNKILNWIKFKEINKSKRWAIYEYNSFIDSYWFGIYKLLYILHKVGFSEFNNLLNNIDYEIFKEIILEYKKNKKLIKEIENFLILNNYKYINKLNESLKDKNLWLIKEKN